jgi:formylglycine-generating enzyme required for sulfatase activity
LETDRARAAYSLRYVVCRNGARFREACVTVTDSLQLVGTTVADKYAVEAIVAEGGFAVVYRAKHLVWKRPVALKVFKALGEVSAADREKLLEEFVQEGTLLAELSERSAAIVQARDIGLLTTSRGEQIPYMVLEWLEGSTLEAALENEKRSASPAPLRTIDEAIRLLDPVAEALALAHMKGIAHRDVKPGNIFLLGDPRGESCAVKLLDFGIAKVVNDAQKMAGSFTKTGGQVTSFTPAYGAPEQFTRTHGATGPWTDVFALALILVEVITGREALEGDDYVQLAVAAALPDRRPTPRTLGATVSDAVEAVFVKALAIKPADRYATAGELWNALRAAIGMAPMRGVTTTTDPKRSARSEAFASTALAPASTPIVASLAASAPTAQIARVSSGGGNGAKIAIGAVAVLAIGGGIAFFALRGGGTSTNASTVASLASGAASSPSASASMSAAPVASAVAGCPADMIAIPGGRFFMGSNDAPNEKPQHQVTLRPFCIDKFEVTTEQYKACSDSGGCLRAGTTNDVPSMTDAEHAAYDPLCNARDPAARGKHPINCVGYDQAAKYCKDVGKRLPTEAEWEFSARGPDGRKYPWGDEEPTSTLLNACDKRCADWGKKAGVKVTSMFTADDGWAATAPVGSFPKGASRYGLDDVVGNVWEWVADWYDTYPSEEQADPSGPPKGELRVIRGGAWNAAMPSWVRPSFRWRDDPATRSHGIGFRCAK